MLSNITIKQLREIRGFSQQYIAMKLGISQSAYCKIENGNVRTDDKNYAMIADLLQVNIEFIRNNCIPIFFYIDEPMDTALMKGNVKTEYLKLILNNIIEQRNLLQRLMANKEI